MIRLTHIGVAVAACCAACAHSERTRPTFPATARETFEKMRDLACAGDATGFFGWVDRTSIARGIGTDVMSRVKNQLLADQHDPAVVDEGMQLASEQLGKDYALNAAETFFIKLEDSIKRRPDPYCRIEILNEASVSGSTCFRVQLKAEQFWFFSKTEGRWLLTGIRSGTDPRACD
jgi:hypothetical protein